MTHPVETLSKLELDPSAMADLVVDLWRIAKRASRSQATPDAVKLACERAIDRTTALGFRMEEFVGEPYSDPMRVRVVHSEGGGANRHISECLSPAVYFDGKLIKQAEVVVTGEDEDDATDR